MGGDHPGAATDPKIVSLTHGLVSYVRELVRNRHKPVRNCERYTSLVWLADLPAGVAVAMSHDEELLVLDHVPHRLHPPLPEILKGWVDAEALKKPAGGDPELAEKGPALIEVEQADGSTRLETATVNRSDQYQVLRAYQEWIIIWRQWAAAEIAAEPRRRLYQEISRIARNVAQADDVYEAVLGVGLLVRDTPEKPRLARHLITRRLAITTDRTTARITVALVPDSPAQFEDRDFLDDDDRYSLERAAQPRTELSDLDPHPLGDDTVLILQCWAEVSLDEGVRFNVGWDRRPPSDGALLLSLAPAILLRERDSSALVQYYDRIAASLTGSGARSPLGLAQLIAPLEKTERLAWNGGGTDRQVGQLQADPLFPLATNAAQRDVLDKLRSDTAVVVQGPPGTGKTHTIANLTCALLAQGQRVLVTSQGHVRRSGV